MVGKFSFYQLRCESYVYGIRRVPFRSYVLDGTKYTMNIIRCFSFVYDVVRSRTLITRTPDLVIAYSG